MSINFRIDPELHRTFWRDMENFLTWENPLTINTCSGDGALAIGSASRPAVPNWTPPAWTQGERLNIYTYPSGVQVLSVVDPKASHYRPLGLLELNIPQVARGVRAFPLQGDSPEITAIYFAPGSPLLSQYTGGDPARHPLLGIPFGATHYGNRHMVERNLSEEEILEFLGIAPQIPKPPPEPFLIPHASTAFGDWLARKKAKK